MLLPLCNFIHAAVSHFTQGRYLFVCPFPLYQLVGVQPIVATSFFYICAHSEQRRSVGSTGGLFSCRGEDSTSEAGVLSELPVVLGYAQG